MLTSPLTGLTQSEAVRTLQERGQNELPQTERRGLFQITLETMREPMFMPLIGAALLYVLLGDLGKGLVLLAGAIAAMGLVIIQEARRERALAALCELAQPHVRVIRYGVEQRFAARDLVPDDLPLIGGGERMPADGLLISGDVLSVNESTLTGESAPVSKHVANEGETWGSPPNWRQAPICVQKFAERDRRLGNDLKGPVNQAHRRLAARL